MLTYGLYLSNQRINYPASIIEAHTVQSLKYPDIRSICDDETELVDKSAISFVCACLCVSNSSMRLFAYFNRVGFAPVSVSRSFSISPSIFASPARAG